MKFFRKWLILAHRYLGIALSLLFVVWFLSGIAMIYARDMPRLTPEVRLERLGALALDQVSATPAEAEELALLATPEAPTLLMVMGRPVYRFPTEPPVTVFADSGNLLEDVGPPRARTIASRFMNVPEDRIRHAGVLTNADQWTIGDRRRMPLHKLVIDDEQGTELYVSEQDGEVAVLTTRGTRALAWVAAIPHWLYFTSLRTNDGLWRQVVLWTSGLGSVLALGGIVLAVLMVRRTKPHIPYAGLVRWHYITGVIFGVFTLTWVFSGLLSMDPLNWADARGSIARDVGESLAGGASDLGAFPPMDADTWRRLFPAGIKEIRFLRVHGDPYYSVQGAAAPVLVDARSLEIRSAPFDTDSILKRVRAVTPGVSILETEILAEYDAYYYSRDRGAPLPVLRIKFDDPEGTWLYIDPRSSQLVRRIHRRGRLNRWLYNGFHSLDFAFWYYSPAWDVGVIALSLGGLASSGIGLFLGLKRVIRWAARTLSANLTKNSETLQL